MIRLTAAKKNGWSSIDLIKLNTPFVHWVMWEWRIWMFNSLIQHCMMMIGMRMMHHQHHHHLEEFNENLLMISWWRREIRTNEVAEFTSVKNTILVGISSSESITSTASCTTETARWEAGWFVGWGWWTISTTNTSIKSSTTAETSTRSEFGTTGEASTTSSSTFESWWRAEWAGAEASTSSNSGWWLKKDENWWDRKNKSLE